MAKENLMQRLPKDVSNASKPGPFHLRNNCPSSSDKEGSNYSVITLTNVLVSSGGPDGKERADNLASRLNVVWDEWINESRCTDPTS